MGSKKTSVSHEVLVAVASATVVMPITDNEYEAIAIRGD
jgi:hypothetical protein